MRLVESILNEKIKKTGLSDFDFGGFVKMPRLLLLDDRLSFGSKYLYCHLKSYMDADGRCFPGVPHLSRASGLSRASIFRYFNELEEFGLIRREARIGRSNIFMIVPVRDIYEDSGNPPFFIKDFYADSMQNRKLENLLPK